MQELIGKIRGTIDAGKSLNLDVFQLLDEFLHQIVIDYLDIMRRQLDLMRNLSTKYSRELYEFGCSAVVDAIDSLQAQESRRKNEIGHFTQDSDENRLFRTSQLKKFFQSELFINISKQETTKKYIELAAIMGASFSALLGFFLEKVSKHNWLFGGIGSASVVSCAIFLYVFKDRLKDRGKNYFFQKMGHFLPDFEEGLFLNRNKIGDIKEKYDIRPKAKVPSHICGLREKFSLTSAENHVAEEVFCYHRLLDLPPDGLSHGSPDSALLEILRINLARYLKHMDDRFKNVPTLNADGGLVTARSPRVYYFYLVLSDSTFTPQKLAFRHVQGEDSSLAGNHKVFRLMLDKKGIKKVELCS